MSTESPILFRRASAVAPSVVDTAAKTVEFVFASTEPVERYGYFPQQNVMGRFEEILGMDVKNVRLDRVKNSVCLLLDNHRADQRVGKVQDCTFDGGTAKAKVKISRSQWGEQFLKDIEDETEPGKSFGYRVYKYEVVTPAKYEMDAETGDRKLTQKAVLKAVDWELFEVSLASIPADSSVGFTEWRKGEEEEAIDLRSVEVDGDIGIEESSDRADKSYPFASWRYVKDLKDNHPEIWKKGGNERGNQAFAYWSEIVEKGTKASDAAKKWRDVERPAWIARHSKAGTGATIQGCVAALKWGYWGAQGEASTRKMINDAKQKDKKSMAELDEDREFDTTDLSARVEKLELSLREKDDRITQLESEKAEIQRRSEVTASWNAFRNTAEQLKRDMKMSSVEFDALFDGDRASADKLLQSADCGQHLFYMRETLATAARRSSGLPTEFRVRDSWEDKFQSDDRTSPSLSGESVDDYAKRITANLSAGGI